MDKIITDLGIRLSAVESTLRDINCHSDRHILSTPSPMLLSPQRSVSTPPISPIYQLSSPTLPYPIQQPHFPTSANPIPLQLPSVPQQSYTENNPPLVRPYPLSPTPGINPPPPPGPLYPPSQGFSAHPPSNQLYEPFASTSSQPHNFTTPSYSHFLSSRTYTLSTQMCTPPSQPSFQAYTPDLHTHSSSAELNGSTSRPQCLAIKAGKRMALDSSAISKHRLADPDTIISRYHTFKTPQKVSTLAQKLALHSYFGKEILQQCTVQGYRDYPALPRPELMQLKQKLFLLFPQYWCSKEDFENIWSACAEAIGQLCKRLRSN